MTRWKAVVEYDGNPFKGFQKQSTGETVEGWLQDAATKFFGKKIKIIGAGRTDAGVHAEGQVVHFESDAPRSKEDIKRGFKALLPEKIQLKEVSEVPDTFHARYDATTREYRYLFTNSTVPVWLKERVAFINVPVDIDRMNVMAGMLIGEHDFSALSNNGSSPTSTIRTIFESGVKERTLDNLYEGEPSVQYYEYRIIGNGFLYRMVRNIVGAMCEVLRGKVSEDDFSRLVRENKTFMYRAAPAEGLSLLGVAYEN